MKINCLIICLLWSISFCIASPINDDEQRVIVRTWYSKPIKKTLDGGFDPPESVGHLSLEIPSKKIYLSLWPDDCCLVADPMMQPIKALFTPSYYRDILQMGRSADSIICLYKLDLYNLSTSIENIKSNTSHWELLSDICTDEMKEKQTHNCATIVFSVLQNVLYEELRLDTESYLQGIYQLNDTFMDIESRQEIFNALSKNWVACDEYGLNFKAWEDCINQNKILSPYPKISLMKRPDIVTPCSINLWVRNLRERERKSFLLDLIPAYEEKGRIEVTNYSFADREEGLDDWSIRTPLRMFGRALYPWGKTYLSEQLVTTVGGYLSMCLLASYKNSPLYIVPVSFFLISGVNLLGKVPHELLYVYHPKRTIGRIYFQPAVLMGGFECLFTRKT